jgi:hypothetical protein
MIGMQKGTPRKKPPGRNPRKEYPQRIRNPQEGTPEGTPRKDPRKEPPGRNPPEGTPRGRNPRTRTLNSEHVGIRREILHLFLKL